MGRRCSSLKGGNQGGGECSKTVRIRTKESPPPKHERGTKIVIGSQAQLGGKVAKRRKVEHKVMTTGNPVGGEKTRKKDGEN